MIYADYSYYMESFFGDLIPEEVFNKYAFRASEYIDRLTMKRAQGYMIQHPDDESVKKACCAAAEKFMMIANAKDATAGEDGEIASETVGGHSVSYRSGLETAAALEAEMRREVESYLVLTGLLYRGISHVHAAHCYTDFG